MFVYKPLIYQSCLQILRNTQRSKSSRNRRKHERKKHSTKEGSVYEDLGLIRSLHELITTIYKSTGTVTLKMSVFSQTFV